MDPKLTISMDALEKLFSTRMAEYEEKLQNASSDVNSAPEITALAREFTDFKSFICQALSNMKTQIELLALGLDRHETAMRRKVLLIHGVPEKSNEKLHDVVVQIVTNQMKLPEVGKDFIHVCHRLGSSQRKSRPILLRLFSMEHRRIIWDGKRSLKGTGITLSEFLTQGRHQTFIAARKHFGVKSCWSVEGKIAIISLDKKRHKLETSDELQQLIAQYPNRVVESDDAVQSEDQRSSIGSPAETTSKRQRKPRRRN